MKTRLTGKNDSQVAVEAAATKSHKDFPEIELLDGTFSIKVTDENDKSKVIYENKKEPFEYYKVPSLASALKLNGAKLDDSQMQFLEEALKGSEETGKAVAKVLDIINTDLRDSAKSSAYARVLNAKSPVSEETIENAKARMVRDFMRQNADATEESAIALLSQFVPSMKGYTLADFRENKGRI